MEPFGDHAPNPTDDHSWAVSDMSKFCRFLCYGSEGDIYTAGEESRMCMESSPAMLSLLQEGRGCEMVEKIKEFSQDGCSIRPDPSLFALAVCSQHSDLKTRQAAFKALKEVCRDPTHLFSFVQFKKELREGMKCGIWGRALRKAVSDWYNEQDAMSLALAVTTCKQRGGWSHQDLLRLSHTKPAHKTTVLISKYLTKGWKGVQLAYKDKENAADVARVLSYLEVVEKVKHSSDEVEVADLIEEHKLGREQLLTDHLRSKEVCRALLKEMPLAAVLKSLGKMTADKVLEPGSSAVAEVCERVQSEAVLKKAFNLSMFVLNYVGEDPPFHPFSENYKRGLGSRGKVKWDPDVNILKALDSAFYKSFENVEPVGKRFAVAVDVSTSLSSTVPGMCVSTAVAAAAVAMVIARTEADTQVLAFSEGVVVPCNISCTMSLIQTTAELVKIPSGSTDGTLPIKWATEQGKAVDVFIVFTNNQYLTCSASPVETLKRHRQKMGTSSKLVMCGLTSSMNTISDTEDKGLFSICGFDLGALDVIRNIALDLI